MQTELILQKQHSESSIRVGSAAQPITEQLISEEEVGQSSPAPPAQKTSASIDDVISANTNNNNVDVDVLRMSVPDIGFNVKLRRRPSSAPTTRHGHPVHRPASASKAVSAKNGTKEEVVLGVFGKNTETAHECQALVEYVPPTEIDGNTQGIYFNYTNASEDKLAHAKNTSRRRVKSATHWRQPRDFREEEKRRNMLRTRPLSATTHNTSAQKLALLSHSATIFERELTQGAIDDVNVAGFVTYKHSGKADNKEEASQLKLSGLTGAAKAGVCSQCACGTLCYATDDDDERYLCEKCVTASIEQQLLAIEAPSTGAYRCNHAMSHLSLLMST